MQKRLIKQHSSHVLFFSLACFNVTVAIGLLYHLGRGEVIQRYFKKAWLYLFSRLFIRFSPLSIWIRSKFFTSFLLNKSSFNDDSKNNVNKEHMVITYNGNKDSFSGPGLDLEECLTGNESLLRKKGENVMLFLKTRKKRKPSTEETQDHEIIQHPTAEVSYTPPEQHRVYVKTFGCSHNGSDTEFMMGLLQSQGYKFTETIDTATIVLINSCTVKNPSQDALISLLNKMGELKKPVVVAGCVPQAERTLKGLEKASLIGTTQLSKILDVFEETLKGNRVVCLNKSELPSLNIPKVRRNKYIEIIPVSSGCLGACTYCKTRYARGRLGSYSLSAILERIEIGVNEGIQQIWITSEDVGAYGIDLQTNIAELLRKILLFLERYQLRTGKRIMLRIGMTNPPYMANHIDAIVETLNHKNCFRFIHIPVQSGSTNILQRMVREYTLENFTSLVDTLIERVPHLTIATDIICGFPTETSKDHQLTMDLIRKYQFQIVNISQFYPRPGTPAARMTRVPTNTVKQRSSEVSDLFRSYRRTDFLIDSYQRVWFSEHNVQHQQTVGHTIHYIKVVVPYSPSLLGQDVWVHITAVSKWQVEGIVLQPSPKAILLNQENDELYTAEERIQLIT